MASKIERCWSKVSEIWNKRRKKMVRIIYLLRMRGWLKRERL